MGQIVCIDIWEDKDVGNSIWWGIVSGIFPRPTINNVLKLYNQNYITQYKLSAGWHTDCGSSGVINSLSFERETRQRHIEKDFARN